MQTLIIALQLLIALGVLNVWLIRHDRPSPWRPDGARNMSEEFERYGFSDRFRKLVGGIKVTLAVLLIAGIWLPPLAVAAAIGMAIMMVGAVGAHLKIGDPLFKALPSLSLLLVSALVAFVNLT